MGKQARWLPLGCWSYRGKRWARDKVKNAYAELEDEWPWRKRALVRDRDDVLGRTGMSKMVSGARLAVGNKDVAELAPWGHRSITGDEHLRGKTTVNVGGEANQRGGRCRRGPGDARCYQEDEGGLGLVGGGRGRPELKKKGDVRLVRNGELAKIEGLPDRFLGRGGRGEQGGAAGGRRSTRGSP
jgi:hypothetical protein